MGAVLLLKDVSILTKLLMEVMVVNIKNIFFGMFSMLLLMPVVSNGTSLRFVPSSQLYDYGDDISVELWADIDKADAILGFGFDLSFGNSSPISDVGDSGDFLTFMGFEVNKNFFYAEGDVATNGVSLFPPGWADHDEIYGEVIVEVPDDQPLYGNNLLLGILSFTVKVLEPDPLGVETITLLQDYDPWSGFSLGLILADTTRGNLMPRNPKATFSPIPEPATMFLLGTGLMVLAGLGRKRQRQ